MQPFAHATVASAPDKASALAGYWFGLNLLQNMFDRLDHGVFLLDAQGCLLFQNQCAQVLVSRSDTLAVVNNRLQPAQQGNQCNWSQALREALAGRQSMLRPGADACTLLVFLPVADTPASRSRMAMVVASRSHGCDAQTLAAFGRLHRLTRSEVQILQQLADGASAHQIAMARAVAVATIRTHIKNLLHKTGHGGLRQLQATLAQLPPVQAASAAPFSLPQLPGRQGLGPVRPAHLSRENVPACPH